MNGAKVESLRQVIAAEQIQKRVKELGRQISDDYGDRQFKLWRFWRMPSCSWRTWCGRSTFRWSASSSNPNTATVGQAGRRDCGDFLQPRAGYSRPAILLVEGLVHSGVTSEFLMNDLRARGAASVKLVTLLDRQSARRVALQPDYFGFLVDEAFLIGYGLGAAEQTNRNIPYLAATPVPQMT